jgi:hypothetical protein
VEIAYGATRCLEHHRRSIEKILWPTTAELIELVSKSNFLQVGKMLGVSDNAVRKRLKNHAT